MLGAPYWCKYLTDMEHGFFLGYTIAGLVACFVIGRDVSDLVRLHSMELQILEMDLLVGDESDLAPGLQLPGSNRRKWGQLPWLC